MKKEKNNKKKSSRFGPITPRRWLIYMIIPTIYLLILTVFTIKASLYNNEEAVVGYNEIGAIDYKVYLKENNYYREEYLEKDMQYIASLIDHIGIDFKYEMHSNEKMDFTYKYSIKGDLLITDPNDNNKLLYKKNSVFVEDKELNDKTPSFTIDENVDIDYGEYNNYVNNFKKEYGLSIKSRLLLTMEVSIVGKSDVLKEDFVKTDKLLISIPMSEQTIDIGIDTSDINNSGTLEKNYLSLIKKPVLLVTGLVVGVLSLVLLYISLYTLLTSRTKKDIYNFTIKSILKEYDRAIVSGKSIEAINNDDYKVIEVSRFEELLDAHDSTGKPILYCEIEKNELSHFIIVSDDILYKFIVNRKDLESKEKARLKEKDQKIESKISIFKHSNKKDKNK